MAKTGEKDSANHVNKTEHVQTDATCTASGYTAGVFCNDCATWIEGHEVIGKLGHSFTDYKSNEDATCLANGTETAKCDRCDATDTREDDESALGHDWNETAYSFADDGSSCTATRVCKRDAEHNETATATITSEITVKATCKDMGTTTYTATFDVEWAKVQTKDIKNIPLADHSYKDATCDAPSTCTVCGATSGEAVGHEWLATTYTWTKVDGGWNCTAERVCAKNCETKYSATVKADADVKDSTCTEKGTVTYTATFSAQWAEAQVKTEDIPAKGHDYKLTKESTPSCESVGFKVYTCSHDSEHTYRVVIDATGHNYGEWELVEHATCARGEITRRYCSYCGGYDEHEDSKRAPHVIYTIEGKDPTCLVKGYTAYEECFNCDYHSTAVVLDELPHEDKNKDGLCDRCQGVMTSEGVCICLCHKTDNAFLKFIYKIILFIWKLFGIKATCACGNVHY